MVNGQDEVPRIRLDRNALHIQFGDLFPPGNASVARRFARRAFLLPEVNTLYLAPSKNQAVAHFLLSDESQRQAFLSRLAAAIGDAGEELADELLPTWTAGEELSLHRFGDGISLFQITQTGPGLLQFKHHTLGKNPSLGRHLETALGAVEGVSEATVSSGKLHIEYDAEFVQILGLIRAVESLLQPAPSAALAKVNPNPTPLGLANATLGLAAVGELALPVVLPLCVGMLIVSNLGTVTEAGRQISRGKLGLPVLYTALLGCSITTGQIVAHALMEWSFRYWAQRSNTMVAEECRTLIEETLPIPEQARLVRSDEVEALVPSESLTPGQRIRLEGQHAIPADGRVVGGFALVEETAVLGTRLPTRKSPGDEVWAGSTLLAGQVEVEILKTGLETRAARIAQTLLETARNLPKDPELQLKANAMADRAVPPTLATAGVGLALGDLFTVGAILHQDHASGPQLAVPLETLRDVGLAARVGALVRHASALERLAESRFVVLDDHPSMALEGLELDRLEIRLAETEADKLLRYVAGAGLYLGDQRSEALANACQARGLVVRRPSLISLGTGEVVVRQGTHKIVLRDGSDERKGESRSLSIEVDGKEVGLVHFRRSPRPLAAKAVKRLREAGMQVFLLSSRPEEETKQLACRIEADLHSGNFSAEEKIRFLQGLKRRGVKPTYIGNGKAPPELTAEAHVSVSIGGADGWPGQPDIVLLGYSLEAFSDLIDLARGREMRVRSTCRKGLFPNLLCVAGAFAGVLNGVTAGLVANMAVYNVYRQSQVSLREIRRPPPLQQTSAL